MKKCGRCGIEKPLDEFNLRPSVKKGLVPQSYCKSCASNVSTNAQRAQQVNDPEGYREAKRVSKRKQTLRKYGITEEQVQAMGEAQNWICYMCPTDIRENHHIDHDHVTGKVRKLLCFHCNVGLGHFRDSIDLLKKAIAYLEEHSV